MKPIYLTFFFFLLFGCIFDKEEEFIPPPLVVADIHGCWLLVEDPRFNSCDKICIDSSGYYYNLYARIADVGGEMISATEFYGNITFVEQHKDKTRGGGYFGNITSINVCLGEGDSIKECNENKSNNYFSRLGYWVKEDALYAGKNIIATRMTHIDEACFSHGYTTGGLIDFDVMFK